MNIVNATDLRNIFIFRGTYIFVTERRLIVCNRAFYAPRARQCLKSDMESKLQQNTSGIPPCDCVPARIQSASACLRILIANLRV